MKILTYGLRGFKPYLFLFGTMALLVITIVFLDYRQPKTTLFPDTDPNYINIIAELPVGTDIEATNEFIKILEAKISEVIEPYKNAVKSVVSIVGEGAIAENEFNSGFNPAKGLLTVTFYEYEKREGVNTAQVMREISEEIIGKYPGVLFTIDKDKNSPPTGKPINIEISGNDFSKLVDISQDIKVLIEGTDIEGIEGLKIDLNVGKPELIVNIDRDKARRFGLSTGQIASTIRTALFGKEISDFKVGEEDIPIQLRLKEEYRYDISSLMNQRITFRSPSNGKIKQVPISSVADFTYGTTYSSVKRKDMKRVITLYSNIIEGYNANSINEEISGFLADYDIPDGYQFSLTGEQEEQKETMAFLIKALFIAVSIILLILVTQFNSLIRPIIILLSIVFSTIGVFGGIATFKLDFVIIMSMVAMLTAEAFTYRSTRMVLPMQKAVSISTMSMQGDIRYP